MKNIKVRLLIFFVFIFIIQIYLLEIFGIFAIKLDLFIPTLVSLSLNYNLGNVLALSFFGGLLQDLSGSFFWGINSFLFCLTGYVIYRFSHTLVIESLFLKLMTVLIATLFINIVKGVFYHLFGANFSLGVVLKIIFLSLFYNLSLSVLVFKIINFICPPRG